MTFVYTNIHSFTRPPYKQEYVVAVSDSPRLGLTTVGEQGFCNRACSPRFMTKFDLIKLADCHDSLFTQRTEFKLRTCLRLCDSVRHGRTVPDQCQARVTQCHRDRDGELAAGEWPGTVESA